LEYFVLDIEDITGYIIGVLFGIFIEGGVSMCLIKKLQVWFIVVIASAGVLALSCSKSTDPEPEPEPVVNDNSPQTVLDYDYFYLNAEDQNEVYPGIQLSWTGYDIDDAGPTNEFEWRLYGPFDDAATLYTTTVLEDCVYDSLGDSFICAEVEVLCLDSLPDAVNDLAQPLAISKGPNYGTDPADVWVTDLETTIFDVYSDLNLTSTSKYQFAFWIRSRDSGELPDESPAFGRFMVYEAMHEHSIMVIDETGYTKMVGRWATSDMDTSKAVLHNLIHSSGYTDFDTTYSTVNPMHYFFSAIKKNIDNDPLPLDVRPDGTRYSWPKLIDVFAHRIIIYYNDDSETGPNETTFGLMPYVFTGLEFGIPAWVMSRQLGCVVWTEPPQAQVTKTQQFQDYFGVQSVTCEGWLNGIFTDPQNPVFNEQFTGVCTGMGSFPCIFVDPTLLDSRYPRMFIDPSHVINELPEVGICTVGPNATPMYQFQSKDGDGSYFHDKTCGVIQENEGVRTACWLFTPITMESSAMQEAFTNILTWLNDTPKSASSYDLESRREKIQRYLQYLSRYASPEERKNLGISIKPFVFVPRR
jgi:hypothetical protein